MMICQLLGNEIFESAFSIFPFVYQFTFASLMTISRNFVPTRGWNRFRGRGGTLSRVSLSRQSVATVSLQLHQNRFPWKSIQVLGPLISA